MPGLSIDLFRSGANRIVFDRAYSDVSTRKEDDKLIAALERHKGSVFIGSSPELDTATGDRHSFSRTSDFVERRRWCRCMGSSRSLEFHGASRPVPRFWASRFRPSRRNWPVYTIRADGFIVPTCRSTSALSRCSAMLDVLKGRVAASKFAGKDVIIAPANQASPDRYGLQWRGVIAGAQIHALGAQTLREGMPVDLGWWPPFLLAALFILIRPARRCLRCERPSGLA